MIRRHTSGMNPCLALSDAANDGPVTPVEYHHPAVEDLRKHANNVVCWSNDIQSLVVEARQPGQFRNMVTIYATQGRTLGEATDITARREYTPKSMPSRAFPGKRKSAPAPAFAGTLQA